MDDGALIDGVVRIDNLRGGESKKGIDRDENDADGVTVNRASPLKVMICADEEGGSDMSFPEGREGAVVGLMNKGEIGVTNLETSQKSIVPSSEIYIRSGYKVGRKGIGGERVRIG